ncbi:MAG: hypothetical protein GHHEDOFH_00185 [Pseudorhodoplanes sp.]|nr:hypothetical protein [Pseudorhodoplanes sp.]
MKIYALFMLLGILTVCAHWPAVRAGRRFSRKSSAPAMLRGA